MTATHNTTRRPRKTTTRRHNGRRLPRLGWGWLGILVAVIGAARTWPVPTGILIGLGGSYLILTVVRPARALPLLHAIQRATRRRRAIPAHGHRTLDAFLHMNPGQFEQAIAELALEDRARVAHATTVGGANDRGADVLVHLHDGRRILIQCKRYQPGNNVGSETVQTINGVYRDIHHCHQAVIVTTADYTHAAHETNHLLGGRIRLINGGELTAWANGALPAPW